jgi:hypothetical protein
VLPQDQIEELKSLCPDAAVFTETGEEFVLLPSLKLPSGATPAVVDGLLCPRSHSGYATRLFLSQPVIGRGNNWTTVRILDRVWHTPSWRDVGADLRLIEIVLGHFNAYR